MVTRLCLAAVLIQLPSADFAAAATVKHKANTWCTLGHLQWALALSWAWGQHLKTSEQVHFRETVQSFQQGHHMTSITSESPYLEHNNNKYLFLGFSTFFIKSAHPSAFYLPCKVTERKFQLTKSQLAMNITMSGKRNIFPWFTSPLNKEMNKKVLLVLELYRSFVKVDVKRVVRRLSRALFEAEALYECEWVCAALYRGAGARWRRSPLNWPKTMYGMLPLARFPSWAKHHPV